jgi:hypothetical protein
MMTGNPLIDLRWYHVSATTVSTEYVVFNVLLEFALSISVCISSLVLQHGLS